MDHSDENSILLRSKKSKDKRKRFLKEVPPDIWDKIKLKEVII